MARLALGKTMCASSSLIVTLSIMESGKCSLRSEGMKAGLSIESLEVTGGAALAPLVPWFQRPTTNRSGRLIEIALFRSRLRSSDCGSLIASMVEVLRTTCTRPRDCGGH